VKVAVAVAVAVGVGDGVGDAQTSVVMVSSHPPFIVPLSAKEKSSTTYSDQVPFGFVPL
jgi:hypothetical protein